MFRFFVALLILSLFWSSSVVAQGETKKDNSKVTNEVEVRFGDNSNLRMLILQDNLEILTKFGKIPVPLAEVRKIEVGLHMDAGVPEKIKAALMNLGSEGFKEREEALNQLVALGPAAYPTLVAAAKSAELEISKRAETGLTRLRAKYKADQLSLTTQDRIITKDSIVSGEIVSSTIKAKTPYFGTVDLKLSDLRSILWLAGNSEVEMSIDAGKYCQTALWFDTGVTVEGGNGLQILASGEVDLLPGNGGGQFLTGPQGSNIHGNAGPGGRLPGMLIGKIGERGATFNVGERYRGSPAQEGKLYLQIVPGRFGGNQPAQGNFEMKIKTGLDVR
jgi:hypothetical protein